MKRISSCARKSSRATAPSLSTGSPNTSVSTTAASPDGVNWTERDVATPHDFFDVIWAGDRFVAVGEVGVIATSSDGTTWAVRSSGDNFFDVAWLGDRLVAVGMAG